MSDHCVESKAVPGRWSPVQVVLVSIVLALLGVLLVAPAFHGSGQAVTTVGIVLAEAITLYVGYGSVTRVASPAVGELLVGD